MTFKKGDKVICIKKNEYTITNTRTKCVVIDVQADGRRINVSTFQQNKIGENVYDVLSEYFKLVKSLTWQERFSK